jgi:hypothetical protein
MPKGRHFRRGPLRGHRRDQEDSIALIERLWSRYSRWLTLDGQDQLRAGGEDADGVVEVAFVSLVVAVRDSENPAEGALLVPLDSWTSFLTSCR